MPSISLNILCRGCISGGFGNHAHTIVVVGIFESFGNRLKLYIPGYESEFVLIFLRYRREDIADAWRGAYAVGIVDCRTDSSAFCFTDVEIGRILLMASAMSDTAW